jgi:hypothetical protein
MKPLKTFSAIFMVLVLAACARTTAPPTTSPRQQETRQTPPDGSEASAQTPESGQQKPRSTSKTGEAPPTQAAASREKPPGPETPAESESQKTAQPAGIGQGSEQDSAEAKLAQARENLRISRETEKRIAAELEDLKESGSASEQTVRDYETYLASVAAMTAENQKIVEQMEAAYTAKSAGMSGSNELNKTFDPDIAEEQTTDEVAALDRQLNASLAKFDGMLLEEMDKIRAGSSKQLQHLAEEAAKAAKRLRGKGLEVETSGSKSSRESQQNQDGGPAADRETDSTGDREGSETASTDGSGRGGEGPSATDQRRRDYDDDDIVARQLREAAENETDPELKEKLWKEYEEYKKSTN